MRRIRMFFVKLAMDVIFDKRCTCGENDRCFICSRSFRFWQYFSEHFFKE